MTYINLNENREDAFLLGRRRSATILSSKSAARFLDHDRKETMMKKAVAIICTAAMLAGSMSIDAFAEVNEDVTGSLTIWEHQYSFEDSLKSVIEGFEALYPNVEVNYEIKDGDEYYTLLQTAIQSGDGPDLFWTNGTATAQMANFVENNALEDLTDIVDYGVFDASAMSMTEIDGKNWSVPWLTMDTRTCYYNKDLFEENGWEIPTTFSEFEALLGQIKDAGIIPISLSDTMWNLLFFFEPLLSAYDVEYTRGLSDYSSKADGQPARDCLKLMLEWADKGYYGENWLGVADWDAQVLAFTTGNAAMYINGSWDAATISENNPDLNYGAFAIPAEDGTTGLVGTPANGFSVNAASNNLNAANAFIQYCATLDAQTIWVQTQGAVSASPDIEASTEIAKEISAGGKGNIYRSWQNVLATCSSTGNATTVWENDFEKVFSGDMTVDEMMDEIAAEME